MSYLVPCLFVFVAYKSLCSHYPFHAFMFTSAPSSQTKNDCNLVLYTRKCGTLRNLRVTKTSVWLIILGSCLFRYVQVQSYIQWNFYIAKRAYIWVMLLHWCCILASYTVHLVWRDLILCSFMFQRLLCPFCIHISYSISVCYDRVLMSEKSSWQLRCLRKGKHKVVMAWRVVYNVLSWALWKGMGVGRK